MIRPVTMETEEENSNWLDQFHKGQFNQISPSVVVQHSPCVCVLVGSCLATKFCYRLIAG